MALSYGNDFDYANNRLRNTLIKYKNYPFFVDYVDIDSGYVCGTILGTKKFMGEKVHINDCDLNPVELGYINYKAVALFSVRMPQRYYRQGITTNTFLFRGEKGWKRGDPFMNEITNCVLNKYPKIDHVIEYVHNKEKESYAFSKKWAVRLSKSDNLLLDYKGKGVGTIKNDMPVLNNKFQFLKESLEEELNVH